MPKTATALPATRRAPEELCAELQDLQKKRRFAIRQQQRSLRSIEAFLARQAGYHNGLPQDERKRLANFAQRLRRLIETQGPDWQPEGSGTQFRHCAALVWNSAQMRGPADALRRVIEDEMRAAARQLPVWPWVAAIPGVSELGLAVIVGETGDLALYDNPAKLWKRLGLAVIDGVRQGGLGKTASAEDWIGHGYNPARRAEVWAFLSDVMLRAQWRAGKDGAPGRAIGRFGEVYARRKEWNLARGWTPAHADNDARRIMSKAFLVALWRAWDGAECVEAPKDLAVPSRPVLRLVA